METPLTADNTAIALVDIQALGHEFMVSQDEEYEWGEMEDSAHRILMVGREMGLRIIHLMYMDGDPRVFQCTPRTLRLLDEDDWKEKIVESCRPIPGEWVARKRLRDPFMHFGRRLRGALSKEHENIVLAGVFTDECFRETAVGATGHGYNVIVPRDGTTDLGGYKRGGLREIRRLSRAHITNTDAVVHAIKNREPVAREKTQMRRFREIIDQFIAS